MLYMFCLCKHIILLVADAMLFSSPEQARQMSQKSGKIIEIKVMAEIQFPILTKQLAYCYRRSVFCKYDRFLLDGYRIYWQMTKTVQTAKQLLKKFQNSIKDDFQTLLLVTKHGFTISNQYEKLETKYCKLNHGSCQKNLKNEVLYCIFGIAVQMPVPKGTYIWSLLQVDVSTSTCLRGQSVHQRSTSISVSCRISRMGKSFLFQTGENMKCSFYCQSKGNEVSYIKYYKSNNPRI